MLRTKEHYDLMTAFERDAHGRVDREPKELWVRGNIYQDGHVNEAFRAYRAGYAYGRFSAQMDSRDEIDALKAENARLDDVAYRAESYKYRMHAMQDEIAMLRELPAKMFEEYAKILSLQGPPPIHITVSQLPEWIKEKK